jgi:thiazolinyl imide reductase
VVCGSRFGATYLAAASQMPELRTVGLIAQGSAHSSWIARQFGIPLYTEAEEVETDYACVAVGGAAGDRLTSSFLRRGVHVLKEHPVQPAALGKALELARVQQVCLHVNSHFGDLAASSEFLRALRRRRGVMRFATVQTSARNLFTSIDLLRRAIGSLAPFSIAAVTRWKRRALLRPGAMPFVAVQLNAAGLPVQLVIHHFAAPVDDGRDTLMSHRIAVGFDDGDVTLLNPYGPVVDSSAVTRGASSKSRSWRLVGPAKGMTLGDLFWKDRLVAHERVLRALRRQSRGGTVPPHQRPEHLLEVSTCWAAVLRAAGPIGVLPSVPSAGRASGARRNPARAGG